MQNVVILPSFKFYIYSSDESFLYYSLSGTHFRIFRSFGNIWIFVKSQHNFTSSLPGLDIYIFLCQAPVGGARSNSDQAQKRVVKLVTIVILMFTLSWLPLQVSWVQLSTIVVKWAEMVLIYIYNVTTTSATRDKYDEDLIFKKDSSNVIEKVNLI